MITNPDKLDFSPYAPVRFQNEFWWRYAIDVARRELVIADGRVVAGLPERIMSELVTPMVSDAVTLMKEEFSERELLGHLAGQFAAKAMEQRHWVPLVAQYTLCGRQIFDLADAVVEMLEQTDFGDCTLEDWNPPYDAMFVRFGKRDEARLQFDHGYECLDGAFVAITPWDDEGTKRRIKIGFTTVKEDGRGVMMPGYFLDIDPEEQKIPVLDAVDSAMKRRMSAFDDVPGESESSKALNAHRRQEVMDGGHILKQAVSLMVNAMFYLESAGRGQRLAPGRDAPAEITAQWANANPRQREKLKSKLLSSGYSAVYLMGNEYGKGSGAIKQGGSKRTHWRRGHWRRQHHGEANSLVKRIWMKPQMIGQNRVHDDIPGHVYIVSNGRESKH